MGAEREERQTELEKRRAQRKERAAQRERQKKARRTLLLRLTAALVLIVGAEREERQTELEKRRAQRKERAAQRERQKKARRTLLLRLTAALVLIALAAGVIVWVNRSGNQNADSATGETVGDTTGQTDANTTAAAVQADQRTEPTQPSATTNRSGNQNADSATGETVGDTTGQTDANTTAAAVQADQRTEPTQPSATTVIHIAAAGDLNITDQVIRNAASGSDYDFTRAFLDVAPVFAEADLAMLNFEGTLAGDLNITDQVIRNAASGSDYDFTRAFLDVAPVFAEADLAMLNFEGTLSGEPYGTETGSANAASGSDYDFTRAFLDVAPVFAEADLAMLNFEGTLSGEPYGTETGSAPVQIAQQLAQIGVDVVQTANSASIRAGVLGLQSTLDGFYQAGVLPVGTFANERTFHKTGGYSIVEVQGIRIALVGFTKGMDNLGLPEGSESCVNVLYTDYTSDYQKVDREKITQVLKNVLVGFTKGMDNLGLPEGSESCVNVLYTDYTSDYQKVDREKITQVLKNVASEKPDLTIAMVHWGSENNEEISATQKEIRDLMLSSGVDVILGSHPHLVQSVEYDPANSTLVAYSLGDFFGDAARAGTAYSVSGVDVILGSHPHLVQSVEYDPANSTLVAYSLGDFFGDAARAGTAYSVILDVEVTRDNASGSVRVTGYDYTPIYTLLPDQSGDGGHRVVRLQETLSRYESNYLGKITPAVYEDMTYALQRIGERIAAKVD